MSAISQLNIRNNKQKLSSGTRQGPAPSKASTPARAPLVIKNRDKQGTGPSQWQDRGDPRRTLIRVAVAVVQRISLQPGDMTGLHNGQRATLAQHAPKSLGTSLPRRIKVGRWTHGARDGASSHVGLGIRLVDDRGALYALDALGLFGVGVAGLVVAEVPDVALDTSRAWSLLSTTSVACLRGWEEASPLSALADKYDCQLSCASRGFARILHTRSHVMCYRRIGNMVSATSLLSQDSERVQGRARVDRKARQVNS